MGEWGVRADERRIQSPFSKKRSVRSRICLAFEAAEKHCMKFLLYITHGLFPYWSSRPESTPEDNTIPAAPLHATSLLVTLSGQIIHAGNGLDTILLPLGQGSAQEVFPHFLNARLTPESQGVLKAFWVKVQEGTIDHFFFLGQIISSENSEPLGGNLEQIGISCWRVSPDGVSVTFHSICAVSSCGESAPPKMIPATDGEPRNELFEDAPFLVWRLDQNHKLIWHNKAYTDLQKEIALKESPQAHVFQAGHEHALANRVQKTKKPQQGRLSRSTIGQSFNFETFVIPDSQENLWFLGFDTSEQDHDQEALRKQLRLFDRLVEQLPLAVAVFGKNRRLQTFNTAFVRLFQWNEKWLAKHPSIDEILDTLRHKRMLPEVIDFLEYKRQLNAFFEDLPPRPHEELIHLPDERSLSMLTASYPGGGLFMSFEDMTEQLHLKRKHNEQSAVLSALTNTAKEGILILGVDHRVIMMNPLCADLWGIGDRKTLGPRTLSELIEAVRPVFYYKHFFGLYKNYLTGCIVNRTPKKEVIFRRDGVILQIEYIPLPNGEHALKFTDITDTLKLQGSSLFSQRLQQIRTDILDQLLLPSNLPRDAVGFSGSSSPQATPWMQNSKFLHTLRETQNLLSLDRPMVREKVLLSEIITDLLPLFGPMIDEKKLTLQVIGLDNAWIVANRNLARRFLGRLLGYVVQESQPGMLVTISLQQREGRINLMVSARVSKHVVKRSTWNTQEANYPWDLSLTLLKEIASLAGGILMATTYHASRLRILCRFADASEPKSPANPMRSTSKAGNTAGR